MTVHPLPVRPQPRPVVPLVATAQGWCSYLLDVWPAVPGLGVDVAPDGELTLTNATGRCVVVLGADDEEFLRLPPGCGPEENLASVTALLEAGADLDAARAWSARGPVWRPLGQGASVSWYDPRTRWTAPEPPPAGLAGDRDRPDQVLQWRVRLLVGTRRVVVRGGLDAVPCGASARGR